MPVYADANGVAVGKFRIPANVRAGNKAVHFEGSGGSVADGSFFGQGTLIEETMQQVIESTTTTVRFVNVDPLAQTFSISRQAMVGGVELFVTAIGSTPLIVQLREVELGVPNRTILAESRLQPGQVNLNQWNQFRFDNLIQLMPDVEYAIVVLANDPVAAVAIAELGKWDNHSGRWVTSQPFQIGVLLSSSNAATWTPHQDRDLTFRLLAARFTQTERIVDLGTVTLNSASELMVMPLMLNPSSQATSDFEVELPGGAVVRAGDQQVISLPGFTSGQVKVKARLRATSSMSASLHPGSQIVQGSVGLNANYISRAVEADAAGSKVRVIFEAFLPSGATLKTSISPTGLDGTWVPISQEGMAKAMGDGWFEYQYVATDVRWATVRVKLELSGAVTSRPVAGKLRVSIT